MDDNSPKDIAMIELPEQGLVPLKSVVEFLAERTLNVIGDENGFFVMLFPKANGDETVSKSAFITNVPPEELAERISNVLKMIDGSVETDSIGDGNFFDGGSEFPEQ